MHNILGKLFRNSQNSFIQLTVLRHGKYTAARDGTKTLTWTQWTQPIQTERERTASKIYKLHDPNARGSSQLFSVSHSAAVDVWAITRAEHWHSLLAGNVPVYASAELLAICRFQSDWYELTWLKGTGHSG